MTKRGGRVRNPPLQKVFRFKAQGYKPAPTEKSKVTGFPLSHGTFWLASLKERVKGEGVHPALL